MTLTLADANRVIASAIAKAAQIGAKMNIAVCDAGGRLVAFQRMDGAMWAGSYGSQGKAVASAAFGRPSGDLTPRADHPTLRGIVMAEGNHMFLGQGAVPIFRGGVIIGACGVGGGTAQEDEDCARAGVESLDPNVWTGGALQEKSVKLECLGLAPMYPAFGWSSCGSWPSWI